MTTASGLKPKPGNPTRRNQAGEKPHTIHVEDRGRGRIFRCATCHKRCIWTLRAALTRGKKIARNSVRSMTADAPFVVARLVGGVIKVMHAWPDGDAGRVVVNTLTRQPKKYVVWVFDPDDELDEAMRHFMRDDTFGIQDDSEGAELESDITGLAKRVFGPSRPLVLGDEERSESE